VSVRDLLDDVAAAATQQRRLDAREALSRARARHRAALRRRVVAGLAAAAAVLLVAVLLPWIPRLLAQPAAPPLGPTGVPARYYTPPVWTPDVLRAPIRAAGLVLQTPLADGRGRVSPGFVLVSADGTQYRRLPGDGADRAVGAALSQDGRWVAWWAKGQDPAKARPPFVIHVLRLDDGARRDVALPGGFTVFTAVWGQDAGTLYVTGGVPDFSGGRSAAWTVDVARGVAASNPASVVAVGPDGTAYGPPYIDPSAGVRPLWVSRQPEDEPLGDLSVDLAISPDGSRWAKASNAVPPPIDTPPGVHLVATDGSVHVWPLLPPPRSMVEVVGWGPRGVLLSEMPVGDVRPGDRTRLLWLDVGTGRVTTASTGPAADGTGRLAVPVAVATDLVRSGRTVPGAAPSWPWWQPERLRHAASTHIALVGGAAASVAAIAVMLAVSAWRRLRRDPER